MSFSRFQVYIYTDKGFQSKMKDHATKRSLEIILAAETGTLRDKLLVFLIAPDSLFTK